MVIEGIEDDRSLSGQKLNLKILKIFFCITCKSWINEEHLLLSHIKFVNEKPLKFISN